MRNRLLSAPPLSVAAGLLLIATTGFGQASTNQWTGGAGNGQWGSGGNWTLGHPPTAAEQAVVPAGSGTIRLPEGGAVVHGVTLQGAPGGANATVLTAGPPGNTDVKVTFGAGGVTVGTGARIEAADGLPGMPGGSVNLVGNGEITNDGEINAGDGGNGPAGVGARPGGSVRIRCRKLLNHNWINAGNGGSKTAAGDPCGPDRGREGGHVDITTSGPSDATELGHIKAGDGGTGPINGQGGSIRLNNKSVNYIPGLHVEGSRIALFSIDPLDLSGAASDSFVANGGTIRIDAPVLILTGMPAGTQVFHATEVCLPLNIVTDPGVTIQSLCGSATVHVGANCASGASSTVLGTESFEDTLGGPPSGWTATTIQGNGFAFVPPNSVPGPADPRFGCKSAVASAAQNGGGPMICVIEASPTDPRIPNLSMTLLTDWTQRFQPAPGSSAQLSVVVNNVPTPAWNTSVPTPSFDFVQVDLTPFLPPIGTPFSLRWQFQGAGNAFWLLDDIAVRVAAPPPVGQPAQPGIALFDVNDARNANNVPVFFGVPGPFFTHVPMNTTVNVHIEGPSTGTCWIGQSFVMPNTMILPGIGQLDLDPLLLLLPVTLPLPGSGALDLPFLVPPPLAGLTLGLQAAVIGPAAPLTLSNAVEIRFGP